MRIIIFIMDINSTEILTAIRSVKIASKACEKIRKELNSIKSVLKDDKSPITIADYCSQAIICNILKTTFPNDNIIAEEDSSQLRSPENLSILEQVTYYVNLFFPDVTPKEVCSWIDFSSKTITDRFWTLDPIDGTKGFLRGDQYAIALALVEEGKVSLGILACPNLYLNRDLSKEKRGCLFLASKGKGAIQMEIDGEKKDLISVSKIDDIRDAIFTESFESSHSDHDFHERLAKKLNIYKPSIRMDSQAKYGIVARGDASFYIRIPSKKGYKEKIWDHAAGSIIAEEAGGKVTDIFGNPLDFSSGVELIKNYGILVSNGILHPMILKALADI